MSFVPAKCPQCGGFIQVDNEKELAVCDSCGQPFVVEKAITNYNTYNNTVVNVNVAGKNEDALRRKGLRLISDPWFDKNELYKIYKDLSDISTNDFYPELFAFLCEYKLNNLEWLCENSNDEEKNILADALVNLMVIDYQKESFDQIKINIVKNFDSFIPAFLLNDKSYRASLGLSLMVDKLNDKNKAVWDKLCNMATAELTEAAESVNSIKKARAIFAYAAYYKNVRSDVKNLVFNAVAAYKPGEISAEEFANLAPLLDMMKEEKLELSGYYVTCANGVKATYKNININGNEFPNENVLAYGHTSTYLFLLIKLNDTEATIIRADGYKSSDYYKHVFSDARYESVEWFMKYADYKKNAPEINLKLVNKAGLSYKKSIFDSILKAVDNLLS